jgi:hypothetical protein
MNRKVPTEEIVLIVMMGVGLLAFILSFAPGCATDYSAVYAGKAHEEAELTRVECRDRGMAYAPESQSTLPFPMLIYSDLPAELSGPPQGRQSLACLGVYMQCENHGTTTRCWCSDTRVIK